MEIAIEQMGKTFFYFALGLSGCFSFQPNLDFFKFSVFWFYPQFRTQFVIKILLYFFHFDIIGLSNFA